MAVQTQMQSQPRAVSDQAWQAGFVVVLGVALVLTALAVVYAKFQSRSLFTELQGLSKAQDRMDVEWGQLQLEQSTWAAHGRVERMASKRLQMVLPEAGQIVVVSP